MADKNVAKKIMEVQLQALGIELNNTSKANRYSFIWNGKEYILYHKNKNELRNYSLLSHLDPESLKKMRNDNERGATPCLAFTVSYKNTEIDKDEIFIFISTIENIYFQIENIYNKSIKIADKTGNVIFKYGNDIERNILSESCDILTSRLSFPKEDNKETK